MLLRLFTTFSVHHVVSVHQLLSHISAIPPAPDCFLWSQSCPTGHEGWQNCKEYTLVMHSILHMSPLLHVFIPKSLQSKHPEGGNRKQLCYNGFLYSQLSLLTTFALSKCMPQLTPFLNNWTLLKDASSQNLRSNNSATQIRSLSSPWIFNGHTPCWSHEFVISQWWIKGLQNVKNTVYLRGLQPCLFRCVLASLYEGVSVRP